MTLRPIDTDFDADDQDDDEESYLLEVTPKGDPATLEAASDALPRFMLECSMTASQLATFKRQPAITAIIKAPGAEWVTPLQEAGKALANWGFCVAASAGRKVKDVIARDQALHALGRGSRVLGVSQNPSQYLPEGLANAADISVVVNLPDDTVIRRTIRAATGRYPKQMPAGIGKGMSFADICFAIRKGSKPSECIDRLLAARRASSMDNEDLSMVPALESLHGYGEAMEWAQRLLSDLDAWRRGELAFSAIERTALLASPPGLGKTTFVRSLAKAAGIPLVATSVSGWFANSSGHLDGVIKQIDQVFQEAAAMSPAIVLIDEIEGLPSRVAMSPRGADWWTPVIGHMLLTLDSAGSGVSSKLIVIGATNHPEKLDPALVRQGRLSTILTIRRPDKEALAGILRQHLGSDLMGEDLSQIASFGVGASGADVTGWVKVARSKARQAGRSIEMADLLEQVAPRDDRTPDVDRRIAIHEAGHAVVMQVLGILEVVSITTVGSDGSGGSTTIGAPSNMTSKSELEDFVTFVLSGRCAEEVLVGSPSSGAGGNRHSDLAKATHMVTVLHASMGMGDHLSYRGNPEDTRELLAMDHRLAQAVEADLQRLYGIATRIVVEYREAVQAVANALLRERHLSGDRFREIFDRHPPGSKTIEMDGRDG